MATLNQILGVLSGVKNNTDRVINGLHRISPAAYAGISGTYRPIDDEDVAYPPEATLVQVRGGEVVDRFSEAMAEVMDMVATVDGTNQTAMANIELRDGAVLAWNVPAVTLLMLEKKVDNIKTFIEKLPVLNPSEDWIFDPTRGVYRTQPVDTFKMQKVRRNHVLAAATPEHPAQVEMYTEDAPVGAWTRVKFSGAFPEVQIRAMLVRVEELRQAVRKARERANGAEVIDLKIGADIMQFVFAPTNTPG